MKTFGIYNEDARKIIDKIRHPIVDVTITSPPYFNLKDYGSKNQIGFHQTYPDYLEDLRFVFDSVFKITKETGTLWVILDTFKKNGEVIPLPFDFSKIIRESGWKLQDIIIWKKERTVPWAHKGQTRSMFEYVLFFSKSKNFKYYEDRIRDHEGLKKWWIKYPERYNPKGKAAEEIWTFDIPTQGSWGNGYVDHFCPLPEELVQRIIRLTTDEGDVVFDPFSGSGTVPAQAAFMKRRHLGFELNKLYIKKFEQYLKKNLIGRRKEYEKLKRLKDEQEKFSRLIINLRILKFGRVLMKKLGELSNESVLYIELSKVKPKEKFKFCVVDYIFYTENKHKKIQQSVKKLIEERPLSKFGIEANIQILGKETLKKRTRGQKTQLFTYSINNTHNYIKGRINTEEGIILSPIKISINEKEFDF